jgi:gliding motility-associated lipoprotein GldH
MRSRLLFLSLIPFAVLSGCKDVMFQQSQQVPNNIWEEESNISFDVEVKDTMSSFDFYIDLRNEATYGYANIFMFVNTTFPSGKTARDTVECILADKTGRWLGTGLGSIKDNHILFKENIRFPNAGTYTFEFEQGMREEQLSGIMDVGISIESHKRK